jgi:hypothetical protein
LLGCSTAGGGGGGGTLAAERGIQGDDWGISRDRPGLRVQCQPLAV